MAKREEKALDRALSTHNRGDGDVAALTDIGEQIRNAYLAVTPDHRVERAMFVQAVAARKSSAGWLRVFAPATVTALLLIGVLFLGRTALPGQTFYPVREVLRTVGLAPASEKEVDSLLTQADRLLDQAEASVTDQPRRAHALAFAATRLLGTAEGAIDELEVDERARFEDELGDLLARARALLAPPPGTDADDDAGLLHDDDDDAPDDDSDDDGPSGHGSDEGSNGDKGPREETRDESGPDDDDDDARRDDDDNSGPGGDDDDNSGPGGDDDDPDDDTIGDGDTIDEDDDGTAGLEEEPDEPDAELEGERV